IPTAIYSSILSFIFGLVAVLFILREEMKEGFQEHLKSAESIFKVIGWTILGIVIAYITQAEAILIEIEVFQIDPGSENTEALMNITRQIPAFIVITAIIAPILEEVVFRKVIFGALYKRTNFFIAGIISALIFGIIHREPAHLLIYATMG